jgi:hypothetical protein
MKLLRTVAPLAQAAIRGAGSLLASLPVAPHERDGHRLDPHTRAVCLAAKLARVPHLATMKPATARRAMEEQMWLLDGPSPEMAEVRDIKLPAGWGELPVRLYRPVNAEVGGMPVEVKLDRDGVNIQPAPPETRPAQGPR